MKKLLLIAFIAIPLLLASIIFTAPDKSTSDNENRSLKTRKDIALASFQTDFEAYLSDQLPLRDEIVSAKSKLMYTLGKRDINGCYICKDRFIQKITDSDIDINSCEKYANKINALAKSTDTYVILVPSAGASQPEYLPKNAKMYDYDALFSDLSSRLDNAELIDVKPVLCSDGAYYFTDHHWTASGAYSAYEQWCKATGKQAIKYDFAAVTSDFRGTLYSKALINKKLSDTIKAPLINDSITVTADGQLIELYDYSALETKDKYNFFEGGNHGILTIENSDVKGSEVLLILKDSFANSFVPFLIPHYSKIIMLDERYTFMSPGDIIEAEGVTQILVLKEIIS